MKKMIYDFAIGFAITAAVSTLFSLYKSTVLEKEIASLYDEIKSTRLQAATA